MMEHRNEDFTGIASHEFSSPDTNMQLQMSASALDQMLSQLNDLHVKLFNVCLKRNVMNLDTAAVPGVPTGRRSDWGIKGEIFDVIDELDDLADRLGE